MRAIICAYEHWCGAACSGGAFEHQMLGNFARAWQALKGVDFVMQLDTPDQTNDIAVNLGARGSLQSLPPAPCREHPTCDTADA